jgi:RNA polymerase sigma-70 factor (ECF subfamily)
VSKQHDETEPTVDTTLAGTRGDGDSSPESTVQLLARARKGDQVALNEVFARAIPLLKRWASGRLPRWARDIVDTDDLVQETVINTLKRIDVFEYRADAAFRPISGRQ